MWKQPLAACECPSPGVATLLVWPGAEHSTFGLVTVFILITSTLHTQRQWLLCCNHAWPNLSLVLEGHFLLQHTASQRAKHHAEFWTMYMTSPHWPTRQVGRNKNHGYYKNLKMLKYVSRNHDNQNKNAVCHKLWHFVNLCKVMATFTKMRWLGVGEYVGIKWRIIQ